MDKLLSPIHKDRPAPAPDVWDLHHYISWRNVIWELISDFVDEEVKAYFLKHPPKYVVSDELDWLDNIVLKVHDREIDSKVELAEMLRHRYDAMRAYHGTRTADIESFYTKGLIPLQPSYFNDQARKIFLSGDYPHLTEKHLEDAIKEVGSDLREGRVFFEANESELLNRCGHYILYGSEYLTGIAAHLGRYPDCRQALKKIGTPTVLICDVPLDLISEHSIRELSGMALEFIFQELLDGKKFRVDRTRASAFSIREPLPASCITGHYHPTGVRDPLR